MRYRRDVGPRRARQRRDAEPQRAHEVGELHRIRPVERRKPQHDPVAPLRAKALRRALGVGERAIVARRRDRDALVDPPIPAIGISRREALLDQPRRPARPRSLRDVGGRHGADAVVLRPRARPQHLHARLRHMRREVDDDVVSRNGARHRRRIEQVDGDRLRAEVGNELGFVRRARDCGHGVASGGKQLHRPPSDHAGRTCNEDFHDAHPSPIDACRERRRGQRGSASYHRAVRISFLTGGAFPSPFSGQGYRI